MKKKSRIFNLKDLRQQCRDLARNLNDNPQEVSLEDVASILEQLIIKLDESQFPSDHHHVIEIESDNIILK